VTKVRYERTGAAAVLTIDRRERRNAVDAETAELLHDGFNRFEADDGARVLVLTGAGPEAFCAGADLKAIAEVGADELPEQIEAVSERPEGPMGFTRLAASKPTIAAISGWCLAGGLELALWCDLRIATATARLGYPERRWGVPLIDGGTQRLPRIVGEGRALELILTGRIVEAEEALRWGLVNEVVAPDRHLERALELAEGLAAFPQETMLSDRRAALEGLGLPLDRALELEAELGRESIAVGIRGAARFAAGEGRGGEGAGA
jgi:enoyl-CoA hydratase